VFTETFEADPWAALFDFADEANRTQFDYHENINYIGTFGQVEYTTEKFSVFAQGAVSTQSYQRTGRFTGIEYDGVDGLGKSEKINKVGYQVKGGAAYRFTPEHSIFANAGTFSRQPFLDNVFLDIRNSNALLEPEVENEEIVGFEGGYRFTGNRLRINVDVYSTEWGNRFLSFGTELPNEDFGIYRFTDVTQVHNGFEMDFEYRVWENNFSLRGYASLGNWKYDGTTPYTLQNDDTGDFVETGEVDLTGVQVGQAAQTSFGLGFVTDIVGGLSFDMDWNVYTDLYEFVNVEDAIEASLAGEVYQPERLDPFSLFDAGLTYNFSLSGSKPIVFRVNCYNLFNTAYISQTDNFGSYLGIGRTWNASLRYNF
jgi:iron complex outermembrane receptor protein